MADPAVEKEEFVKKELKKEGIHDFFQSSVLSDITIVNQQTGAQYKCHKLVLASCSQYFLELFLREDNAIINKVRKWILFDNCYTSSMRLSQ